MAPQYRLLDIQPWPGLVTSEENKSCSSVASRWTCWPRHQHSPEHRRLMMARRISASRVKTSLTSPVRVYPVSLSWESCGCHETCSLSSSKHSVAPQIVLKINFLPIKISLNMVRYSEVMKVNITGYPQTILQSVTSQCYFQSSCSLCLSLSLMCYVWTGWTQ